MMFKLVNLVTSVFFMHVKMIHCPVIDVLYKAHSDDRGWTQKQFYSALLSKRYTAFKTHTLHLFVSERC